MKRLIVGFAVLVVLVGLGQIEASIVLDQSYTDVGGPSSFSVAKQAQTFRVGITGTLKYVDLPLDRHTGPEWNSQGEMWIYIYDVTGGWPTGPILGGAKLWRMDLPLVRYWPPEEGGGFRPPEWTRFEFGDIEVTAGDQLAVVVQPFTDMQSVDWWGANTIIAEDGTLLGGYPDGRALIGTGGYWAPVGGLYDYNFRTFVEPIPEPSTFIIWSLLGALGITIAWWRRRRGA